MRRRRRKSTLWQIAWLTAVLRGLMLWNRIFVRVCLFDDTVFFVGVCCSLTRDEFLFSASEDLSDVLGFNFLVSKFIGHLAF